MRRIDWLAAAAAVIVGSVGITLYLVNLRERDRAIADVPAATEEVVVVSPEDLLQPDEPEPPAAAPGLDDAPGDEAPPPVPTAGPEVLAGLWEPGTTAIEDARPVTDAGPYIAPEWSPTGLDIAFTRPAYDLLAITGPTGAGMRLLADDPGIGRHFRWNRDGMSLQVREPDGRYADLMITGERYPAPDPPDTFFTRDGVLFMRRLNEPPLRISGAQDVFTSPSLSPDGTKVLFLGRETGIYLARADGTHVLPVGPGANPKWVPDSEAIVFDRPVSDGTVVVESDLYFASADGRELTNLTNTPTIIETHPAVSPSGNQIAFISGGIVYAGKFRRGR